MDRTPENEGEAAVVPEPAEVADVSGGADAPKRSLLTRFRNCIWDWRAVVAVGIAMFVIGGLAGLGLGLALDRGSGRGYGHDRGAHHGPGRNFGPGQHGQHGGSGPSGQMPGHGG